jgi:5'-nucleotidase
VTLILDCDDTTIDLMKVWLENYNSDYNDNLTREQITDWDISQFVVPECGKKIFKYIKEPSIYKNALPVEGVLEAVNKLREYGFRIVFATAFEPRFSYAKFTWLNKHGFNVDKKDYVECNDKSLIIGNALVDDKYETIKNFPELGILYSAPWNLKYDYKTRVNNWQQVIDFMTKNPPGEL